MLVLRNAVINYLIKEHGEPDMIGAYVEPRDFSIVNSQTILMVNDKKIISVTIGKIYNELKSVKEFDKQDIKEISVSKSFMTSKLILETNSYKGTFIIKNKIPTLGKTQKKFLDKLTIFVSSINNNRSNID